LKRENDYHLLYPKRLAKADNHLVKMDMQMFYEQKINELIAADWVSSSQTITQNFDSKDIYSFGTVQ